MEKRNYYWFNLTVAIFSSFSLVASITPSNGPFPYLASAESTTTSTSTENDSADPSNMILDSEENTDPPFEEDRTNVDEDGPSANGSEKKIIYDTNMNYGTGSPIPKEAPISTVKKNLIAVTSSLIVGTIAMLVVASGKGSDAPHSSKK